MTYRQLVTIGVLSLLWLLPCSADVPSSETPAQRTPNIVIIYADDLGYGDIACNNPEAKIPTPHVDRLAREGVRFDRAYDMKTLTPRPEWQQLYDEVKTEVRQMGLTAL